MSEKKIAQTPIPPYPEYSDELLSQPADYGVLKQLEGTWVNYNPDKKDVGWGLHTTCMPSPGTNSETIFGIFHFLCENYTEELTFSLVDGGVRNRGGTNEQFAGAVKYNQSIQRVSDGVGIHEEDGMYLWMNPMYNHAATEESIIADNGFPGIAIGAGANGPNYVPPYSIARSGTIPHGSAIMITGGFQADIPGKPEYPTGADCWTQPFTQSWPTTPPPEDDTIVPAAIAANPVPLAGSPLAISPSMGAAALLSVGDGSPPAPLNLDAPAPAWAFDKSLPTTQPDSNLTYFQRIVAHPNYPYSVRPNLRLRDAIKDQRMEKYTLIQLTSKHNGGPQGGILNTPFVSTFANVTEMSLNLWIQTVIDSDGCEVLQLQYEQVLFFEFMFGSNGQVTRWPHIQVNTLRKKPSGKIPLSY
ncbi:peroxidase, FMP-type [Chromobacterium subtsugae]|uniref:peroxidase, FMP-type n=2 Tax=Chromobacterium subtsugae TaxID=251747 RepID=UPI000B25BE34|nr:peroxidase, FMP-type [Chromobacterium subtsugae]